MILPKSKWPKYLLQFKQLKGICCGKCKDGDIIKHAHAHCKPYTKVRGWICLRNKSMIRNRFLMLHEIGHLLAGYKNSHNKVWRKAVLSIGGTLNEFPITKTVFAADMHKKSRK